MEQRRDYAEGGVREYHIVHHSPERLSFLSRGPANTFESILDEDGIVRSRTLPGFQLRIPADRGRFGLTELPIPGSSIGAGTARGDATPSRQRPVAGVATPREAVALDTPPPARVTMHGHDQRGGHRIAGRSGSWPSPVHAGFRRKNPPPSLAPLRRVPAAPAAARPDTQCRDGGDLAAPRRRPSRPHRAHLQPRSEERCNRVSPCQARSGLRTFQRRSLKILRS